MRRRVLIRTVLRSTLVIGILAWLLVGCGGGSSGGCDFDGDCEAGQVCLDRQCISLSGCASDADCRSPQVCRDGQCVSECRYDSDCTSPEVCRDGQCVSECRYDSDCTSPEVCRGGQCVDESECQTDGDCTPPEVCRNGRCLIEGACQVNADCEVPLVCVAGECVEPEPGEFVLRVTDSPVADGEAEVVVEALDPDFIPDSVQLYLDGEFFVTFKSLRLRFTLDTRTHSNGRHDLRLQLTDAAGAVMNGRTSFMVHNASVDVISAETPTYAYPGQTLELWLEVTGPLSRIEPDFSAIDDGFVRNQVQDSMDAGRHKISYTIPDNPTGGEGSYDIPIAIIATDGGQYVYRGLSFYLGAGPLMPFESDDGILQMESIPAQGAPDAALYVSAMKIDQPSIITGGRVDIDLQFEGEIDDGKVLIGLEGWGGYLLIPVSSMELVDGFHRLALSLPEDSIDGEVEFRFTAAAMDSSGRIGIDQRRRRLAIVPIFGVYVPKGALRITLTWPKADRPDLDLHVIEPNDIEIYWGRKHHSQCDSRLDLDANGMCPSNGLTLNREVYNAFLPIGGDYQVKVDYHASCDHEGSVPYEVTIEGCGATWHTDKNSPAQPDGGGAGSGELVHTFHCNDHYWVEGQAKYRYWKMRNYAAAGDVGKLANVPFKLYDYTDHEIPMAPNAKATTDKSGNFKAAFELDDARAAHEVKLKFLADDPEVTVYELKHDATDAAPHCCTGDADKIFTFTHPVGWIPMSFPKKTLPMVQIPLHDSAGFHVFRVMKRAKKYYTTLFKDWNTSFPKVEVETLRGENPNCSGDRTSCFSPNTNRFYLLGDYAHDQDYYDDGIMLHELGHFVMENAAYDHSSGPTHHRDHQYVPEVAWSEGIATYLAQSIIESSDTGQGKWYCDRTFASDGCSEFGDLIDIPLGTDDGTSTGWLSEDVVLSLMWDMRDSDDDYDDDPVEINETAFLKWVFDKSAANKADTMQDAANWDKGTAAKTDMADMIHLFGCELTESTTPKKSDLKKLMKDRFELEWLDEDGFCD